MIYGVSSIVKGSGVKGYTVEVQYQSISGNACVRRLFVMSSDPFEAIQTAQDTVSKLQNFGKSVGGSVLDSKEIK